MYLKIAIVEDDDDSAELLKNYIKRLETETEFKFDVKRFSDGDEIASDYNFSFDIIFLDIQMKRLNGIETAEYIRKFDKDVILVFITNMAQFAIKGYKVNALNFLLKPVSYFAFSEQIKSSAAGIKNRRAHYILLDTEKGIEKIDTSNITHIESFGHKNFIYTLNETLVVSKPLKDIENMLKDICFFRCNKGCIINLKFVSGVYGNDIKVVGRLIGVSRGKKKEFMEALTDFVGGGG